MPVRVVAKSSTVQLLPNLRRFFREDYSFMGRHYPPTATADFIIKLAGEPSGVTGIQSNTLIRAGFLRQFKQQVTAATCIYVAEYVVSIA